MKIEAYSDGSATSEGKPGGYGWCLVINDQLSEHGSGYLESASNNDAELMGAIESLRAAMKYFPELDPMHKFTYGDAVAHLPPHREVTLVSDSKLILGWASGEYRFKQLNKIDKYDQLMKLMKTLNAQTRWIKGHSGHEFNELCDKLANNARLQLSNEIETKEKKASGETLIGKRKTGIVCFYYKDKLKVVDFSKNLVEDYDRELHGTRGGVLEIREEKSR